METIKKKGGLVLGLNLVVASQKHHLPVMKIVATSDHNK